MSRYDAQIGKWTIEWGWDAPVVVRIGTYYAQAWERRGYRRVDTDAVPDVWLGWKAPPPGDLDQEEWVGQLELIATIAAVNGGTDADLRNAIVDCTRANETQVYLPNRPGEDAVAAVGRRLLAMKWEAFPTVGSLAERLAAETQLPADKVRGALLQSLDGACPRGCRTVKVRPGIPCITCGTVVDL